MHFYDVGGVLVRRWVPAQRRIAMEMWNGEGWTAYPDVDALLRHGRRLTEVEALAAIHGTRDRRGTLPRFTDDQARAALRDRLRRA